MLRENAPEHAVYVNESTSNLNAFWSQMVSSPENLALALKAALAQTTPTLIEVTTADLEAA